MIGRRSAARHTLVSIMVVAAAAGMVHAADSQPSSAPAVVTVQKVGKATYFADAHGLTLYTYKYDGSLIFNCDFECAAQWPPLEATKDDKPTGDWTVYRRQRFLGVDNIQTIGYQWAYKRAPVYRYHGDHRAGEAKGAGMVDYWRPLEAVPPPPTVVTPPSLRPVWQDGRYVMVDGAGAVAFTAGKAKCGSRCGERRPFTAPALARPVGAWGIVSADGSRYWTFHAQRVYLSTPGQTVEAIRGAGGKEISL